MDGIVSLSDVANIVVFVAPGYFAIQAYSLIYPQRDRDFSRLVIESVIFSLPLVAIANIFWGHILGKPAVTALDVLYTCTVLATAVVSGVIFAQLRLRWPIRTIAEKFDIGSPHEFVKTQLLRIDATDPDNNSVVVKLKSGAVFSGTADQLSRYSPEGPMYYYFSNLAWLDKRGRWQEREGGVIVERSEIEYIETPVLSDRR